MFCSNCGSILSDEVNFCSNCGTRVSTDKKNASSQYQQDDTSKLEKNDASFINLFMFGVISIPLYSLLIG